MRQRHRPMKKYTPRRRKADKRHVKQQLLDFKRMISMDLGCYLILFNEGNQNQIEEARIKARSSVLKYGEEMRKMANILGGEIPEAVESFLKTIQLITHSPAIQIDDNAVRLQADCGLKIDHLITAIAA